MRSQRHAVRSDEGAVIIIVALLVTAMFVIVALVIDLGMVRQNRQADKSSSDFAVTAGVRSLDNGSGLLQSWRGVCTALDYLLANNAELTGLTSPTYEDGAGTPEAVGNPCASAASLPAEFCSSDKSTWGVFKGFFAEGRIHVTIRNGYEMPDPSFPEDGDEYLGDVSSSPCHNLAVIIEEREGAYFGGVAGASDYTTRIRSVARYVPDDGGELPPALLLLERTLCKALHVQGSNAFVRVEGIGGNPGVIHSDSNGTDAACESNNNNVFEVDSTPTIPQLVALRGVTLPAQITTVALSGLGNPSVAASPSPNEVCVQVDHDDCEMPDPPGPVEGGGPAGRGLVTRKVVDERYRAGIAALRATAEAWFLAGPGSFDRVVDCNNEGGPFTEAKILVDCDGTDAFGASGATKIFGPTVETVVIDGFVRVEGSGSSLQFQGPTDVFVRGTDAAGVELAGATGNSILVNNDGTLADPDSDGYLCEHSSAPRAVLVIDNGPLTASGAAKTLRMCQTTVFMMDDDATATTPCAIPGPNVVLAPYDNDCDGRIDITGNATLDWTAPNHGADHDELEDLALWTETSGMSIIQGGGAIGLEGVFFSPNASPFRVAGEGGYSIENAQFITRRLEVAGNGVLVMRPDPADTVPIPSGSGTWLVR